MKVVLDTNIIISGLRFSGKPRHILELISAGQHSGFTSDVAIQEIETVLLKKFKVLPAEWIMISEALRDFLTVMPIQELPQVPELWDTRDVHILAAAELCAPDCIVSGDRDLLVLNQYKNIPIIKASDFIQLIELEKV